MPVAVAPVAVAGDSAVLCSPQRALEPFAAVHPDALVVSRVPELEGEHARSSPFVAGGLGLDRCGAEWLCRG